MDAGFHRLFQITGIQKMFDLQSQITEDHREGEVLQITSIRDEPCSTCLSDYQL